MSSRRVVRSLRVLTDSSQSPLPADVVIEAGKVERVAEYGTSSAPGAGEVWDAGALLVMPGIVDTHAHINEPGRTDWEGFQTATRAAAAGGTTTVVDMPLNSIPATTTLAALRLKEETAAGKCSIDYGFWGGVVPGNEAELEPMVRAGALGFKCFLIESGVDEFPMSREPDLLKAMPILARLGVPLLVHAELDDGHKGPSVQGAYRDFMDSRPQSWEVEAVRMMIRLARHTGCRTHIVHLSAADALADLRDARAAGVPITVETCPHYLFFEAEKIGDGQTQYKCCPPIRDHSNREALWQGLRDGVIDFIVSDHSPCTPALKALEKGDFASAWGGIAGLQFSARVVYTELKRRGMGARELVKWMCESPAHFAGLEGVKGRIAPGYDADLVVWDPEAEVTVEAAQVLHKHRLTPYESARLLGRVERTYLRGVPVKPLALAGTPGPGRAVRRGGHAPTIQRSPQ